VLYLLEVDGMVAAFAAGFIFMVSGLFTLSLLAWRQVKALATPRFFLSKEKR